MRQPRLFDDLSPGEKLKQEGIKRVMANPATPETWKEQALKLSLKFLKTTEYFITLDLREYCRKQGLPPAHHNRVWGGLMQRLHKDGHITPTETFTAVEDPTSHNAPRRVWHSNI